MTDIGPRSRALLSTGLLPLEAVVQLQRWGALPRDLNVAVEDLDEETLVDRLRAVLDNEAITELRDTDLDALKIYLRSRYKARLYVTINNVASHLDVSCCTTRSGDFLIPWQSESIREVLLDPSTYLRLPNQTKVQFADVRDLYFAETKAFLVCTPQEQHG
jgi:hypothetical protein